MTVPPPTRRDDTVDILHGVAVADPYRWLEDGDSPEVHEWVAAQNAVTRQALDALPDRGEWHGRLVALMDLPVVQAAALAGSRVVLLERQPGEQQARLVSRDLSGPVVSIQRGGGSAAGAPLDHLDLAVEPVVICDPAGMAGAGTDAAMAIDWFEVSGNGELVAYGTSEGGTEDSVLRVARTADGTELGVAIAHARACSVGWDADGRGFHYTRYPEGDQYHRSVYHHRLGTAPDGSADPLVWAEHPVPDAWPMVAASPGGRWLLVTVGVGWSRTDLHLLDRDSGEWRTLVLGEDVSTEFAFVGDLALVGTTTHAAPRGRVVRIDLTAELPGGPADWPELVPERELVTGAPGVAGHGFYVVASQAGIDRLEYWTLDGDGPQVVPLPGVVSVVGVDTPGHAAPGHALDDGALAVVTGFGEPPAVWRVEPTAATRVHPDLDRTLVPDLAVEHVEYPSLDGTPVGLFVIHRADVAPGPDTPTILNGYGGFAIAESPTWSPLIGAWCAAGGQYAIAQLRGGFEHGEEWHHAGWRGNKQNVFDDFAAAGDWLVAEGRTSRARLAIAGGSNGGLLVGATITQRPDLCAAAWCAVPLLDMVRFPQFLIARLWTHEYGDPDEPEAFAWLHAYSPYHRVVDGTAYPATLLTTAEGDTRVDPCHARKMAARLQEAIAEVAGAGPVLLHQEGRAGHGQGKPVGKRADEYADVLSFLTAHLS
ncbi:MAG TPA: prolyl oligopeptidase family serine peptidase [Ilumatobacter sp.]|nr:prolyl oligopeptidase family serine peptidase [Ilumatobacter sp.]